MWLCRQFCRLIQRICRQKAQGFNKITPESLKTVNHRCKRQAHTKSCARTATLHSSSLAEVETGCRRATTALWSGRSAGSGIINCFDFRYIHNVPAEVNEQLRLGV